MFESEIAINEFLLNQFASTICDVPHNTFFLPGAGHGHPPVWIVGHLGLTGEMGQRQLGGSIAHIEWLRLFARGSSDQVPPSDDLNRDAMASVVIEAYRALRIRAAEADEELVSRPHGVKIFEGTSIRTIKHSISLILTNHFGFHLAQLSSCRRAAGHRALF